jgi:hypothetical protein
MGMHSIPDVYQVQVRHQRSSFPGVAFSREPIGSRNSTSDAIGETAAGRHAVAK